MKTFILLLCALLILSFKDPHPTKEILTAVSDTIIIAHVLDGEVGEWPIEKFEEDKSTSIKYAVDNDAQNLYVAMIIPQFPIQMKMMRQGMELYVDIKGKKKEGKGIEFPVKGESTGFSGGSGFQNNNNGQQRDQQNGQRGFDKKEARTRYAMNLFALKLFGFNDDMEPAKQGLTLEGSANIGFSWDSSDVMYVEYAIPLPILDKASLNQKIISIGWKLNGMETTTVTSTTTQIVSRPSGNRGINNRSTPTTTPSGNRPSQQDIEAFMKDQSFWTKYTVNIPSN